MLREQALREGVKKKIKKVEFSFFDSTQSQVSYSEVGNGTRQCALGPIMGPTLYLWCLGSNLDAQIGPMGAEKQQRT